ncbi:hypothetical protein GGH92_008365, partial [Coemansia sp. RSA 2673]
MTSHELTSNGLRLHIDPPFLPEPVFKLERVQEDQRSSSKELELLERLESLGISLQKGYVINIAVFDGRCRIWNTQADKFSTIILRKSVIEVTNLKHP